jgi:hypothetical protein
MSKALKDAAVSSAKVSTLQEEISDQAETINKQKLQINYWRS